MSMTRRTFLPAAAAAPWLMRAARAAARRNDRSGRVLVVLQLAGGNDGLNTAVPYEDDLYARARTTLRLTAGQVHKIGNGLGLHPALDGMARLFGEGRLAILQGVGYPNMHRDHNAGMRNWQTASTVEGEQTGWLGRVADRVSNIDQGDVPAVFVGEIAQPFTIHARQAVVPALRTAQEWTTPAPAPASAAGGRKDGLLDFISHATGAAFAGARRVDAVLEAAGGCDYPQYPLAQSFQSVAQLIRAELGIRIFLVELGGPSPGGFDNHSNQAANHAVILKELSDSIAAFHADLARDRLIERVLLMTYSEFGRTLSENGRHGTGHGAAAPVFLAGGNLKAGVHGIHPSLSDLDQDAPKPHTDFRRVYATVLERWLAIPSEAILGQHFDSLDVV